MGLDTWIIPGGKYLQEKIWDWGLKLDQISGVFSKMISRGELENTRPTLEYYRSMRELRLLIPIKR